MWTSVDWESKKIKKLMEYRAVLGYDSYLENIEKIIIVWLNFRGKRYTLDNKEKIKLEVVYPYYLGEY